MAEQAYTQSSGYATHGRLRVERNGEVELKRKRASGAGINDWYCQLAGDERMARQKKEEAKEETKPAVPTGPTLYEFENKGTPLTEKEKTIQEKPKTRRKRSTASSSTATSSPSPPAKKERKTAKKTPKTQTVKIKIEGNEELVVANLVKMLKEGTTSEKEKAAKALGTIGSMISMVSLQEALSDSNAKVRSAAEKSSLKIIERSSLILLEGAKSTNPFLYQMSKVAIANLSNEDVSAISDALLQAHSKVSSVSQTKTGGNEGELDTMHFQRGRDIAERRDELDEIVNKLDERSSGGKKSQNPSKTARQPLMHQIARAINPVKTATEAIINPRKPFPGKEGRSEGKGEEKNPEINPSELKEALAGEDMLGSSGRKEKIKKSKE